MEPAPEQIAGVAEWIASRPEKIRAIAQRFDPWTIYRLKSTNQRVLTHSFDEEIDGSVSMTVKILQALNSNVLFDRYVFGIDPDDLESCEGIEES